MKTKIFSILVIVFLASCSLPKKYVNFPDDTREARWQRMGYTCEFVTIKVKNPYNTPESINIGGMITPLGAKEKVTFKTTPGRYEIETSTGGCEEVSLIGCFEYKFEL